MISWLAHRRHRHWSELLSASLDGELKPGEAARLAAHLERCERCRTELEAARVLQAALSHQPAIRAPRSFQLTADMIAGTAPGASRRAPVALRLAQGVAVVAVIGFGTVLGMDLTSNSGSGHTRASEPVAAQTRAPAATTPEGSKSSSEPTATPSPAASPTVPGIAPPPLTGGAHAQSLPTGPTVPSPTLKARLFAETEEATPTPDATAADRAQEQQQPPQPAPQAAHVVRSSEATWYRPAEVGLAAAAACATILALTFEIRRHRSP